MDKSMENSLRCFSTACAVSISAWQLCCYCLSTVKLHVMKRPFLPRAPQSMWGGHRSRWCDFDRVPTVLRSRYCCILISQTNRQTHTLTHYRNAAIAFELTHFAQNHNECNIISFKKMCKSLFMIDVILSYSPFVEKLKNTHMGFSVSCDAAIYKFYIRFIDIFSWL